MPSDIADGRRNRRRIGGGILSRGRGSHVLTAVFVSEQSAITRRGGRQRRTLRTQSPRIMHVAACRACRPARRARLDTSVPGLQSLVAATGRGVNTTWQPKLRCVVGRRPVRAPAVGGPARRTAGGAFEQRRMPIVGWRVLITGVEADRSPRCRDGRRTGGARLGQSRGGCRQPR